MLVVPILPVRGDYSILPSGDGKTVSGLFANIDLEIVGLGVSNISASFRLDLGAACSGMSLFQAHKLGLVRDNDREVDLTVRTASEMKAVRRVRIGTLAVRIPKLRPAPFNWPIIFHPEWHEKGLLLLGLAGVVNDLTILFDGTANDMSEYGSVSITMRDPSAGRATT